MNFRSFRLAILVPLASLIVGCTTQPSPESSGGVDFSTEIKPILQDRCVMCHNKETLPARTSFESRKLAFAGDKQGPVIIPGNPTASRMILAISAADVHEQAMPPVSHRVSKAEIDLLSRWIKEGAQWPAGAAGAIVPTERVLE